MIYSDDVNVGRDAIQNKVRQYLLERKRAVNTSAPDDYAGEDGLFYCGKCHTVKQYVDEEFGGEVFWKECKCQAEESARRAKAEQEAEELAKKKALADRLREKCFSDLVLHGVTFDNASDDKHITIAKRYIEKWNQMENDNIGLLLWGNTGSGKTFTAVCIANALIDEGVSVLFEKSTDIISNIQNYPHDREQYLKELTTVDLLVIDDLGAERDTSYAQEQLCDVIDKRVQAKKPLIVTTNFSIQQINSGDSGLSFQRIFSRLKSACVPVRVIGDDRRATIGADKMERAKELLEL